MKKLIIKSIIFLIPFLLLISSIVVIDPFNYFHIFKLTDDTVKKQLSSQINYALWKVIDFKDKPAPNIILGDSRMNKIRSEVVKELTGDDYFNFCYGGGTLQEIINTFWYADSLTDLKSVYIGLSLVLYNMSNMRDRVRDAIDTTEKPLLYLVNRDVIKASFRLLKTVFEKDFDDIETPNMDRDEFWAYQLGIPTTRYFANYIYPDQIYQKLRELVNYCNNKNIKVIFIIPPTHISLQEKIKEFYLIEAQKRFLKDIMALGTVYDFDYPNILTENRRNFADPYHLNKEMIHLITQEIWGSERRYYKINGSAS